MPPTPSPEPKKLEHRHPNTYRAVKYYFGCPKCQADDAERSGIDKKRLSDEDMTRTFFLIPQNEYDHDVCSSYVMNKYPGALAVGSQIPLRELVHSMDAQVVVVIRRGSKGRPPGKGWERAVDAEGKWVDARVPAEKYWPEVIESAPLVVRDCVSKTEGSMFVLAKVDDRELIDQLADLAYPFKISPPRTEKDNLLTLQFGI